MFIPMDVPIYGTMLAPEGTPPGIQVRIKPGYRAVAMPLDEVSGVSYQVEPGDRVDVVALVKAPKASGGSEQMSRIILQNIEVATVGRQLHTDKKGETVKSVARSVTLLLTPEEVTRLHLAQSMGGRLSLALRGNQEDVPGEDEGTAGSTSNNLAGTDPVMHDDPPAPRPAAAPPWNVMVISGEKVDNVDYRWQDGRWMSAPGASGPGNLSYPGAPPIPPPPKGAEKIHETKDDFDSAPAEDWAEES
jgi:pilus assembly protein CpaB